MENQYFKCSPDIMVGKKILYVHGFMSAASTHTVSLLQQLLSGSKVIAEDLPIHPKSAMELLKNLCEKEKPDLIIGTSMGGMYTEMLYGYDRIVVNPAFQMGQTMYEHGMTGKQTYQNPRKDGVKDVIVTKQLVNEYEEITHECFSSITENERNRVYGLFGDKDPVVHTFNLFRKYYPQAIRFHGEHRLNESVIFHYLLPVIRWIDDRQEGRERPIIFISYETMIDNKGNALVSCHKAYEYLLTNYNVFIVAPAPTNDHNELNANAELIEKYFSAPQWNRVIYTNYPQLLYGDYYISRCQQKESMASVILFGSDDLKTWDDVITYFSRLGGQ
jgi:predicted esterase YcpF (UPF0227 family)